MRWPSSSVARGPDAGVRLGWKAVLGIVVTVVALWWTLKGEDLAEVWARRIRPELRLGVVVRTYVKRVAAHPHREGQRLNEAM